MRSIVEYGTIWDMQEYLTGTSSVTKSAVEFFRMFTFIKRLSTISL